MRIEQKQEKVDSFLRQSHTIIEKYFPNSFRYKNSVNSVTGYMFLYNPDNNYLFKASHASKFADYIEFYDDWGAGDAVKLDVYYKMCDALVQEIKENEELLRINASRITYAGFPFEEFHPDIEKHILAYDLIYCYKNYDLLSGIED